MKCRWCLIMELKIIILLLFPAIISAKISINISAGALKSDTNVTYTGAYVKVIDDYDKRQFGLDHKHLYNAVEKHYGRRPTKVFLKSPTPWGDLYETYHWEQVTKVVKITSAKIKIISRNPVIIKSDDFVNTLNNTIKVNTGISQTVENSIATTYSQSHEFTLSQEFEYDVNVIFAKGGGSTGVSYTTSWGKSEEKSVTVTIGSNTGMETELQPGQAITASLTAHRGIVEVEVKYVATLRGNVAVNYRNQHKGHHFWGPSIEDIMNEGSLNNNLRITEVIKLDFYMDASLVVYDKETGLPL